MFLLCRFQVNKHLASAMQDDRSLDLFRTCNNCGKKMLKNLLQDHEGFCIKRKSKASTAPKPPGGAIEGEAEEEEQEDSDGEGKSEPVVSDGVEESAVLRENVVGECPFCGRTFMGREVPDRHFKRCQDKDEQTKRREEQRMKMEEERKVSYDTFIACLPAYLAMVIL